MTSVSISEDIQASASRVWALIGDFGAISDWLPAAEASEADGNGVGAVRKLSLAGGATADERLESYDEAGRSYTYTVIESSLPMTGYRATVHVEDRGSDACTLHWSSTFEPVGIPESDMAGMIEGSYQGGVENIRARMAG